MSLVLCMFCFCACNGQTQKEIKLNAPDKTRGHAVMKAFDQRKSIKDFPDRKLSLQDLSDLLWAANGENRPETGHRTAPSALNKQDIDIYVCMKEGAYLYHAKEHKLVFVTQEDVRPLVAGSQDYAAKAPVCLVLASDISKFSGSESDRLLLGALDAGIVSQNICLFCAGTDLATVPRRYMDIEKLSQALKLKPEQRLMLNNPVGYLK